ncbi:Ig-like domain-containing protein [Saccharicrinis aurantiacus]|uniref:Ig-like domain-containing protein n=1 Tax=Saccharicrinis aurantiacus TaxID=1849719 RepID=UPI00248F78B2|nr:Ig-like domain-containing protein [Saccharicrinis aurantiacus]
MNIRVTVFLNLIFLSLVFASCGKDEVEDTEAPTASISSPVENRVYPMSSTLFLSATFEDNKELKEVTCSLRKVSESNKSTMGWDEVWNPTPVTFPLSGTNDAIESQWLFEETIPSIMIGDYVVVVTVSDHSKNFTTYEIPITIN